MILLSVFLRKKVYPEAAQGESGIIKSTVTQKRPLDRAAF
jgi:hypothetical protein